jgi:hypothetical protein
MWDGRSVVIFEHRIFFMYYYFGVARARTNHRVVSKSISREAAMARA